MNGKAIIALLISTLLLLSAMPAGAQKLPVSGKLKGLNGYVKIATDQATGNGIIVWSRGETGDNSFGRVYAAELTRLADGSYEVSDPVMISNDSGSNQRPVAVFLPAVGKYFIIWDASYFDLTEYWNLYEQVHAYITQQRFATVEVYGRTYTPGGTTGPPAARLGSIASLRDNEFVLNVVPNAVALDPTSKGDAQQVFVTCMCSTEVEPMEAGIWGAVLQVGSSRGADITKLRSNQMTSWELLGVTVSGFYSGGKVYTAMADFIFYEEATYGGRGHIAVFDPLTLSLQDHYTTGEVDLGYTPPPMNLSGQVINLGPGAAASPTADFYIAGISTIDTAVSSIAGALDSDTYNKWNSPSNKPAEIVDVRLFATSDAKGGNRKVYALYHTNKGKFYYRALDQVGRPVDKAKKAFKTKKGRLKWMDVAAYGNDALVAWSEKMNENLYEIYFQKYTVAK